MYFEDIKVGMTVDIAPAVIEKEKCYRGITGNPAIDKNDIGLDRYFDKGLERALKIIDNHMIGK